MRGLILRLFIALSHNYYKCTETVIIAVIFINTKSTIKDTLNINYQRISTRVIAHNFFSTDKDLTRKDADTYIPSNMKPKKCTV